MIVLDWACKMAIMPSFSMCLIEYYVMEPFEGLPSLSFLSTSVSQTQMLRLWQYQNVVHTFMWELLDTSHIPLKLKTIVIILYCPLFFISSYSTYFK